MAGIQLSGLSSGLDTETMITQLMAIERQPRTKLSLKQTTLHARQDALTAINDKLKALKTASDALSSAGTWAPAQTVSVSDANKASARVTGGAGPGTYVVNVTRLASADQRTYDYATSGANRTVTLNGKSLTINAGASIDDIVTSINGDTAYGVFAVNANNRLVLAARTTGAASAITLTGGGGLLTEDISVRKQGVDSAYTLDGRAYNSATNTLTATSAPAGGFIPGVELTLKTADAVNYNVTVTNPAPDKQLISDKTKAFVDAYNTAMDAMRSSVQEKPVAGATTDLDARKGALYADPMVKGLIDKLRASTSTFQGATGTALYDEMYEIGVSTGAGSGSSTFSQDAVNGKLTFDSAKFSAAYDANPLAVQKLVGAVTGTNGFTQSFATTINPYSQTGGILNQTIDSAGSEITRLDKSLADMDNRLSRKEDALRRMFTNMELALQKARSQGQDMLSKLGIPSTSN
jgi:flagellar hook-associated protein 2